jgi:hypothetical protein
VTAGALAALTIVGCITMKQAGGWTALALLEHEWRKRI